MGNKPQMIDYQILPKEDRIEIYSIDSISDFDISIEDFWAFVQKNKMNFRRANKDACIEEGLYEMDEYFELEYDIIKEHLIEYLCKIKKL